MEWSAEQIERLRTLWDEGLSTAQIADRLGVTKNAVVGKAHRIELPARPSPIRPNPDSNWREKAAQARRAGRDTLPLLACLRGATQAPAARRAFVPKVVHPRAATERPTAAMSVTKYGRVIECCWPIGEPRTSSFRFCCSPSEPGRSYCHDHCKVAYIEIRDRREDAA